MLNYLWQQTLGLIYPPFCYYCLAYLDENEPLCVRCSNLIKPIASISLPLGKNREMTVHAAGVYDDPLRPLIMAKLHRQRIACRHMAYILWERVLSEGKIQKLSNQVGHDYEANDCSSGPGRALVPVPLHWTRYAWRGYNQAEVIAQELSKLSGLPVINALKRVRATNSQTHVRGSDRSANVQKAFVLNVNADQIAGRRLILIDDLMTTGATLIEAGRVLNAAKPANIDTLVVARALPEH